MNLKIAVLVLAVAFLSMGCSSYGSFIDTLNERQVNSCIEGDVSVGSAFPTGQASGILHVYSATGGALVQECIKAFRFQTDVSSDTKELKFLSTDDNFTIIDPKSDSK